MDKLLNIQVLRAVAALFVVVFHTGLETTRIAVSTGREPLFDHARWNIGVSLFFAISGFIMVVTCRDSFGKPGQALAFLRRRLLRIVPIYWLLTLGIALLYMAVPQATRTPVNISSDVPLSLLFWPFARPDGDVRPLVTPGWTLNLELWFYAVFTLGLLFRRRLGWMLVASIITGLSVLRMNEGFSSVALQFWGDPIVFGFLAGMAVGVVFLQGPRLPISVAMLFIGAGLVLSLTGGIRSLPEDALLARLSNIVPATLVLIGAALGPQIKPESLGWRPFVILGDASYSLYLVHEFVLRPLRLGWEKTAPGLPLPLFVGLGIAVSIISGLLCYFLLERPMTRWLAQQNKKIDSPPGCAAASPAL